MLNGAATAFNASGELAGSILLDAIGTGFDRWTNFALLALGLVALDHETDHRTARRVGLGLLDRSSPGGAGTPSNSRLGAEGSAIADLGLQGTLFVAIIVGAVAFLHHFRRPQARASTVWALVLAGLGVRYAELSTWFGIGGLQSLLTPPPTLMEALSRPAFDPSAS